MKTLRAIGELALLWIVITIGLAAAAAVLSQFDVVRFDQFHTRRMT